MAKSILPIIKKEEREEKNESTLTPEVIMHLLFSYRDISHKFHLNCFITNVGSHAEHLALNGLYKGIQEIQDSILEQMMGYLQAPINAPSTSILAPNYKDTKDSVRLCSAIIDFAEELIEFADSNNMPNIENIAQELSGLAAQTRYFLMFK